jgi:hypothetical protein
MAKVISERRHFQENPAEFNIIPIMGLTCILIPLLVYSFSFYQIKMQPVSAPKMDFGVSDRTEGDQQKPLNLTLIISQKGFMLRMEESIVQGMPASINIGKKQISSETLKDESVYDFPALYNKLVEIKKQFKEENTINISADNDIKWEIIARTIDTARIFLGKDFFADFEDYLKAKERKDIEGNPVPLFPVIVFAVVE